MKNIPPFFIAIMIVIIGAVAFLAFPRAGTPVDAKMTQAQSKVRQLLLATQLYYLDKQKETPATAAYPKTFSELVPLYLSSSDLEKLTSGLQMDYFPPKSSDPSLTQPIIIAHIPHWVIYGFTSAEVSSNKLK